MTTRTVKTVSIHTAHVSVHKVHGACADISANRVDDCIKIIGISVMTHLMNNDVMIGGVMIVAMILSTILIGRLDKWLENLDK